MSKQIFSHPDRFEFGPFSFSPADAEDQYLFTALVAHGASEDDASTWVCDWCALVTDGEFEMLALLWKECPCSPTTPPLVRRYFLVDLVAQSVLVRQSKSPASEWPVVPNSPLAVAEWPDELSEMIAAELAQMGEEGLADELREDEARFWLAYYAGWAQTMANTSAHNIRSEYRALVPLATIATKCIAPVSKEPLVHVSYKGEPVKLPVDYRLAVPDVAVQVRNEPGADNRFRMWLFPVESYRLGPRPLDIRVAAADVHVDERLLVEAFDRVSVVHLCETGSAQSPFRLKIVGKCGENAVELVFQRAPRSAWRDLSC